MIEDINELAGAEDDGEIILSTGVVVRARRVPDEILIRMRARYKPPKVPMWRNPDKGRDEENPNDPEYIAAKRQYDAEFALTANNSLLMFGAQVVRIPEGMPGPDDAEWIEELDLLGMASGTGKAARLFDWLTLKAAPEREDRKALLYAIGRATGTMEADVQAASKSAGRHAARRTD